MRERGEVLTLYILWDITNHQSMRVALDISVLAAALRSQLGASNRVLALVAQRRCSSIVTTAVFLEYELPPISQTV